MTVVEYLEQIEKIDDSIKSLEEHLKELRDEYVGIQAIRYDREKVDSTPGNTFEEKMIKYLTVTEELQAEILDKKADLWKIRNEIEQQIEGLPKRLHIEILRQHYVYHYNFRIVASRLNYSYDRIIHAHRDAIEIFAHIYNMPSGLKDSIQ